MINTIVQRIHCPKCGGHIKRDKLEYRYVDCEPCNRKLAYELANIPYCPECGELYTLTIDTEALTIKISQYSLY